MNYIEEHMDRGNRKLVYALKHAAATELCVSFFDGKIKLMASQAKPANAQAALPLALRKQ